MALKILHVDPERAWGGGEEQVIELTTYLSRAGHRSEVACDAAGELCRRLQEQKLPWLPLRVRSDGDLLAAWRLRHLVRAARYDLVHFHTARAHALAPWLHGIQVKRVVTRRMDYPVKKSIWSRLLYTRSVDAVIAISMGVQTALQAGAVPAEHMRLIPSGVDMNRFSSAPQTREQLRLRYGFSEHEIVILSVGALVERKGHLTLLSAVRHLRNQGTQLRYLVCGDGPLRTALASEAHKLGVAENVVFAGFCDDIPAHLAAVDLFVHIPRWEGLGVAVIEALAAGLPVVASGVGGIPELIKDGVTGLLVPPQDSVAVARALQRLINDPGYARTLGQTGQTLVRSKFDIKAMARANEALYYELLAVSRHV
jgi:glycosyltransferase involved in cell wall biosynthesis